jgi:hypothetical protein
MSFGKTANEPGVQEIEEILSVLARLKEKLKTQDPICVYFIQMCELALIEAEQREHTPH